jgi:hypothetical protein
MRADWRQGKGCKVFGGNLRENFERHKRHFGLYCGRAGSAGSLGKVMKLKFLASSLACLAALTFLLTGCGSGSKRMNTADFKAAFAGASGDVKSAADEVVQALEAGKYFEGATALANLAKSTESLSDDQKNAMINLGADIQVIVAENPESADPQVYQAIEDMMAALEGRQAAPVGVNPDAPGQAPPPAE